MRAELRRLSQILKQNVSFVKITPSLVQNAWINTNRLTAIYRPALSIIEILLTSQGISLEAKKDDFKLPGFLFDMNRFYQALIFRFLSENLIGYEVRNEYRLSGMLEYHPRHNPQWRRAATIRPDFAILKDRNVVALLDKKYRDLWEKSLPREMLYQLSMYAFSQDKPGTAKIFYPTTNFEAREAWIEVQHPISNDRLAKVILRPVNIIALERLINASNIATIQRERSYFVSKMVFG